jgi:hypothetical protein
MSKVTTTMAFWPELEKLLDLPDEVYELTLHCKVDELVTLELKTYVKPIQIKEGDIVREIKKYYLTEIEDDATT